MFDAVELNQRDDGTEGLLVDDVHLLGAVVEDGGSIEVSLVAYAVAAAEQLGTLLDGTLDLLGDALKGTGLNERTHIDGVVLADIAHLDLGHLVDENLCELSLYFLGHIDAFGIVADLTVVADAAVDNPLGRLLQVGILADDGGSLATQFEAYLGDVLRGGSHDALAGTYGTCHADDVDLGRSGHLVADDAALTGHDIDDALGQSDLIDYFAEYGAVLGGQL